MLIQGWEVARQLLGGGQRERQLSFKFSVTEGLNKQDMLIFA